MWTEGTEALLAIGLAASMNKGLEVETSLWLEQCKLFSVAGILGA